jgi:hypothetical protein
MSVSFPLAWTRQSAVALLLCLVLAPTTTVAELTLEVAEQLALTADPAVAGARARGLALQQQAVADGQLPDPKLGFGAYNVPVDSFSLDRIHACSSRFHAAIRSATSVSAANGWVARSSRQRP